MNLKKWLLMTVLFSLFLISMVNAQPYLVVEDDFENATISAGIWTKAPGTPFVYGSPGIHNVFLKPEYTPEWQLTLNRTIEFDLYFPEDKGYWWPSASFNSEIWFRGELNRFIVRGSSYYDWIGIETQSKNYPLRFTIRNPSTANNWPHSSNPMGSPWGRWWHFKIDLVDDKVNFYVNGTHIHPWIPNITVPMPPFTNMYVGIRAVSRGYYGARIDNFKFYTENLPVWIERLRPDSVRVSGYHKNRNYCGQRSLQPIGSCTGDGEGNRYLIKIDFTKLNIPPEAEILYSDLYIHNYNPGEFNFYKYPDDWTECSVTWNNRPPDGELIGTYSGPWGQNIYDTDWTKLHFECPSQTGGNPCWDELRDYIEYEKEADGVASFSVCKTTFDWGWQHSTYYNILWTYPRFLVPLIPEVNTTWYQSLDWWLEESNIVNLTVNSSSIVDLNITYEDNREAFVDYCDENNTVCTNITDLIPYLENYPTFSGLMNVSWDIWPRTEVWDGFGVGVFYDGITEWHNKTVVENFTMGYSKPLYTYEIDYPTVMYILENNTLIIRCYPFYEYAIPNLTLYFSTPYPEYADYYWSDSEGNEFEFTPSSTFNYTYFNFNKFLEVNITIYPKSPDFHKFTINSSYVSVYTPETFVGFYKSDELPEDDPDYIDIRYRYTPIEYPLEEKTLMLQFHHFTGNMTKCEEVENETYCYVNVTIECRTCNTTSKKQLVQYWVNETDQCDELFTTEEPNGVLARMKYWGYPVEMILLDRDVCDNTTLITEQTGFIPKGSLTSLDNRDKFVFINTTDEKHNENVIDFADAINLNVIWEEGTGLTDVKDKKGSKKATTDEIYTVKTEITDSHAKFWIANEHPQTIWLDEIRIPNTFKYEYLKSIDGLWTSHSGKKIDLKVEYDAETDECMITPVKGKIPVEPATGSNILELVGNPSPAYFILALLPLIIGVGIVVFVVREGMTGELDLDKIIAIIITVVVAIALLGVLIAIL